MTEALPLTYIEIVGGTPLLVLHGLFGSARNWATMAKRFGERRRVYALDLRNHGGSPWSADMSYPAMAADLLRFMDDRGIAKASVVGHSMGGKAAMALCLLHPDRVERLLAADIAPVSYTHTFAPYVSAMKAVRLEGLTRRSEVDSQLAAAVTEPTLRSFLLQNLVLENGQFRWRINLDAIDTAMTTLTGFPDFGSRRYEGPTLFLGGSKSSYLAPEHHGAVRHYFPSAAIRMMEGAGHWLHAEKPEAFADAVESFL